METKRKIYLQSYHIFGRHNVKANTVLSKKDISQIHAAIRWEGTRWVILDHSRNGTWIDNKRLFKGENVEISIGNVIRFGSSQDSCFKIIDLLPPSAILVSLKNDSEIIKLEQLHILPDEQNPLVSIYLSESGKWKYEKGEHVDLLNNGDIIEINSVLWRFCNPITEDSTLDLDVKKNVNMPEPEFIFYVSLDEEHVSIKFSINTEEISLGERAHHYLLLTLARRKIKDCQSGVDPLSQGWIGIDELSRMLDLDQCHLNIQIYRARKQIVSTLPDAPNLVRIIERRTGDIRFGISKFKIFFGSTLEGECNEINEVM